MALQNIHLLPACGSVGAKLQITRHEVWPLPVQMLTGTVKAVASGQSRKTGFSAHRAHTLLHTHEGELVAPTNGFPSFYPLLLIRSFK